jgi:hypothetical protein
VYNLQTSRGEKNEMIKKNSKEGKEKKRKRINHLKKQVFMEDRK